MSNNLKAARERVAKKKMSQEEVANELGISLSAYQKYEQGQRELKGDTLVRLAEILKVSVDTILGTDYSALRDDDDFFTSDERRLVKSYRRLSDRDKDVALRVIDALGR